MISSLSSTDALDFIKEGNLLESSEENMLIWGENILLTPFLELRTNPKMGEPLLFFKHSNFLNCNK